MNLKEEKNKEESRPDYTKQIEMYLDHAFNTPVNHARIQNVGLADFSFSFGSDLFIFIPGIL